MLNNWIYKQNSKFDQIILTEVDTQKLKAQLKKCKLKIVNIMYRVAK